jgi:hypothetical protein
MSTNFQPVISYSQPSYQVIQILQQAYRMAGALKNPGTGISVPSETDEGLFIANAMIDGWKTENLMVIYERRTVQDMVIGQQSYSVGPGQDFDIERPEHIRHASFLVGTAPNFTELKMRPILNYQEWQSVILKNMETSYPLMFYYQAAVPYGAFRVWPVPNQVSQIAIYTPQYLSEFATVDDNAVFPDGFREMIIYNLAVRVHQRYPDKPMDPSVAQMAVTYKNRIKSNLMTPMLISADPAVSQEDYNRRFSGGYGQLWIPPCF